MKTNSSLEKNAPLVATTLSLILAVVKLIVGIMSGSVALLASAMDSIMDMFVSVFNFLALRISDKKPTDEFSYGYGKIEAVVATLEGVLVFGSGLFIIYEAVKKFINGEDVTHLDLSIYVMIFSLIVVFGLVSFLGYVVKKTGNMVIKADLLHYKTDLFSNSAVLASLIIIYFTNFFWVDVVFGLVIGVYILKEASELIKEGVEVLLDVSLEKDEVEKIIEVIKSDEGVKDFHFLKTRHAGKFKFVEVHLVVGKDISLMDAHVIADRVEENIKKLDDESNWHIMIHLDPVDDSQRHSF
jgi:cation diffusion facilitator family transporter